ncbi:hypothetical protein BDZ97DRAFT_1113703 [Flammula alnicola]|nr:hypothetical protein BDZ97DRAFT_1113703 [Flammula alnicola]
MTLRSSVSAHGHGLLVPCDFGRQSPSSDVVNRNRWLDLQQARTRTSTKTSGSPRPRCVQCFSLHFLHLPFFVVSVIRLLHDVNSASSPVLALLCSSFYESASGGLPLILVRFPYFSFTTAIEPLRIRSTLSNPLPPGLFMVKKHLARLRLAFLRAYMRVHDPGHLWESGAGLNSRLNVIEVLQLHSQFLLSPYSPLLIILMTCDLLDLMLASSKLRFLVLCDMFVL